MTERPKILVAEPDAFCAPAREILERAGDVELREVRGAALSAAFAKYDAIWMRLATRIDATVIGDNPRCKVLAAAVTGIDHFDLDALGAHGVAVVCLKGEAEFLKEVRATSEMAVALAMALMRRIPWAFDSVKDGVWNRDLFAGHELYRKTAGVIGLGRLGRIVAEYFRAFGMEVIGYDPRPDYPTEAAERVDNLDELLARADVVSIHAVYDETTHDLIDAARIAQMKRTAVLVNTSRGGILDEGALLEALAAGQIAGAALDVLAAEPAVLRDDPLIEYARTHDNLLLVPHLGGKTYESMEKTEVFIAEKLVRALESS